MAVEISCACRHRAELHHRDQDGSERCIYTCGCRGFVPLNTAPLCLCGHVAGMHSFWGRQGCRFRKYCGCTAYRAIPLVPFEQLQELSLGCETVVVVVPVANWDADHPTKTADLIAGDLSQTATMVLVQDGPSLYFVSKHPERDKVGAAYLTEDSLRESLLQMKRKYQREGQTIPAQKGTNDGVRGPPSV